MCEPKEIDLKECPCNPPPKPCVCKCTCQASSLRNPEPVDCVCKCTCQPKPVKCTCLPEPPKECPEKKLPAFELYFDVVMLELNNIIGDQEATSLNILSFCIGLMQIVERYPDLHGRDKKKLVIKVLTVYLEQHHCDMYLMTMISSFIDTGIGLDSGKVSIKLDIDAEIPMGCIAACLSGIVSKSRIKREARLHKRLRKQQHEHPC